SSCASTRISASSGMTISETLEYSRWPSGMRFTLVVPVIFPVARTITFCSRVTAVFSLVEGSRKVPITSTWSLGRTQPPTEAFLVASMVMARVFFCTLVERRSEARIVSNWLHRSGSPACSGTRIFWFTTWEADSGRTTDEVTNCSGTGRWEIMSSVTTVPSGMSEAATTTGTRFQPRRTSDSFFLMAEKAIAPANTARTSATSSGVFPFSIAHGLRGEERGDGTRGEKTVSKMRPIARSRKGGIEDEVNAVVVRVVRPQHHLDHVHPPARVGERRWDDPQRDADHQRQHQQGVEHGVFEHRLPAAPGAAALPGTAELGNGSHGSGLAAHSTPRRAEVNRANGRGPWAPRHDPAPTPPAKRRPRGPPA